MSHICVINVLLSLSDASIAVFAAGEGLSILNGLLCSYIQRNSG